MTELPRAYESDDVDLDDLAPALTEKLDELYDLWTSRHPGERFVLTSGLRSFGRQAELYVAWHRDGATVARDTFGVLGKPSPAMMSRHHPQPEHGWKATAADIAVRGYPSPMKQSRQQELAIAAEEVGLISGRTWNDPWHVELPPTPGTSSGKWERYLDLARRFDELIEAQRA